MKIVADTNLLVRLAVSDDSVQRRIAAKAVKEAEAVIIGNLALSELVWVLRSRYGFARAEIISAIDSLCGIANVAIDRAAVVEAIAVMRAGADLADGVIAYEGAWLGGETFVSFDKKAVAAIEKQGQKAKLLR